MTAQEMFDRVATHLLRQGKKSVMLNMSGDGKKCRYRGPDGLRCAVGCLIPDELYDPRIEGLAVVDPLAPRYTARKDLMLKIQRDSGIRDEHYLLAAELQEVHDESFPMNWPAQLGAVAAHHNLDPSVLWEGV